MEDNKENAQSCTQCGDKLNTMEKVVLNGKCAKCNNKDLSVKKCPKCLGRGGLTYPCSRCGKSSPR